MKVKQSNHLACILLFFKKTHLRLRVKKSGSNEKDFGTLSLKKLLSELSSGGRNSPIILLYPPSHVANGLPPIPFAPRPHLPFLPVSSLQSRWGASAIHTEPPLHSQPCSRDGPAGSLRAPELFFAR